jgi:hypothetical protein
MSWLPFANKFFGPKEPDQAPSDSEDYEIISNPESCVAAESKKEDDPGLHVRIFPCAAITFIPKECGQCHKIVGRRGFCFQEWKKDTGHCQKCLKRVPVKQV